MSEKTREQLIDEATDATLRGTCKAEYDVVNDYPELDLDDDEVLASMVRIGISHCDACGWVMDDHDATENAMGDFVCPDCVEDDED